MEYKEIENLYGLEKEIAIIDEFRKQDPNSKENTLQEYLIKNKYGFKNTFNLKKASILSLSIENIQNKTNETFNTEIESYNNILLKWKNLAKEIGIYNSMELSDLYSYLLWNGYFSLNKNHIYKIEERKNILGCFGFDVINGGGVCLNYSDMLKDFLNINGYQSALITCQVKNTNIKRNYEPKIQRNIEEAHLYTKGLLKILGPLAKDVGNHAVTLIKDNDLYSYDATNLLSFYLDENNIIKTLDNNNSFVLKPKISYILALSEDERQLIKESVTNKNIICPYNDFDYQNIFESTINNCEKNKCLIEDCYSETISDIKIITESLKGEKTKKYYKNKCKEK